MKTKYDWYKQNQYNMLSTCLYECKGRKNGCGYYAEYITKNNTTTCNWYQTIKDDIVKIKTGKGKPTFSLLEKILKDNN